MREKWVSEERREWVNTSNLCYKPSLFCCHKQLPALHLFICTTESPFLIPKLPKATLQSRQFPKRSCLSSTFVLLTCLFWARCFQNLLWPFYNVFALPLFYKITRSLGSRWNLNPISSATRTVAIVSRTLPGHASLVHSTVLRPDDLIYIYIIYSSFFCSHNHAGAHCNVSWLGWFSLNVPWPYIGIHNDSSRWKHSAL